MPTLVELLRTYKAIDEQNRQEVSVLTKLHPACKCQSGKHIKELDQTSEICTSVISANDVGISTIAGQTNAQDVLTTENRHGRSSQRLRIAKKDDVVTI